MHQNISPLCDFFTEFDKFPVWESLKFAEDFKETSPENQTNFSHIQTYLL